MGEILNISTCVIDTRRVLQEGSKYYPQVFLKKCSYEFINKPTDNISHIFMSSVLILNCTQTR